MAIQMRRGFKADIDPTKMLPGEWAIAIDSETENQIVWMCFSPGVVKRMGTYEDFEDMIKEILSDGGGAITDEQIVSAVEKYMAENPVAGADGKSAYAYAQEGGFTGTEEEFAEKLASEIPTNTSDLTNDSGYQTEDDVKSLIDTYINEALGGDY